MPDLSVRKLDTIVYQQLRQRAATHSISMEEEVRRILSEALAAPLHINEIFLECFGERNGIDFDIPTQRGPHEPVDFQE